MKNRIIFWRNIKMSFVLIVLCFLIAFSERKQNDILCQDVLVEIENTENNYFLDEHSIRQLIHSGGHHILGMKMNKIAYKEIEQIITTDKHVKSAEVFADMKGNLIAHVKLREPIARIVSPNDPDVYIANDGDLMPVSEKFTARVILISVDKSSDWMKADTMLKTTDGQKLMNMLSYIKASQFWYAQIAQIDVDKKLNMILYPQVTNQRIEFGTPENIEEKFKKLMIFYKDILPYRGWNNYHRVNVKYAGQIITE